MALATSLCLQSLAAPSLMAGKTEKEFTAIEMQDMLTAPAGRHQADPAEVQRLLQEASRRGEKSFTFNGKTIYTGEGARKKKVALAKWRRHPKHYDTGQKVCLGLLGLTIAGGAATFATWQTGHIPGT
ncbi:hypothetical protein EIL50_04190, partial [bacterium NHP-B]